MLCLHTPIRRQGLQGYRFLCSTRHTARLHATARAFQGDPRLKEKSGRISDEFATLRGEYQAPKHAIILAHGLFGFDELHLEPQALRSLNLPGIHYWRGITDALAAKNVEVITANVPPSGSIERRAERLAERIAAKAQGKAVNIIAHSMGGLDSRYMISQLKPSGVKVLSLTTIATPHRGSAFADYMFKLLGANNIPRLFKVLEFFGLETEAFEQLTKQHMLNSFNPRTPDDESVRYFSYGAALYPHFTSVFRASHSIVLREEGDNDGLVSVDSAKWGDYKGTIENVSHLDLINWTNRLRWYIFELTGRKRTFNAIALYLHIADMLAKEGL